MMTEGRKLASVPMWPMILAGFLALTLSHGCSTPNSAPVSERASVGQGPQGSQKSMAGTRSQQKPVASAATQNRGTTAQVPQGTASRPEIHVVQKGETLFSIARAYGVSYQDLGSWNNLYNYNAIREGDQLRLHPFAHANTLPQVKVIPLKLDLPPQGKPIGEQIPPPALEGGEPGAPSELGDPLQRDIPLKTEPKASKVRYLEKSVAAFSHANGAGIATKSEPSPVVPPRVLSRGVPTPESKLEANNEAIALAKENESLQWIWPTSGNIITAYNESAKGVQISGTLGQPIYASADGQISYIGNSLRGYGKMVVIKHNRTYLSVYAHNSAVFVKEGQTVTRGQKIAEMGNSDSLDGSVKLHFEIRRLGKPVDPVKYLPNQRSS